MAYTRSNLAAYQTVAVHGGVAASDPHRLVLMLMDGAIERIMAARGAIENGIPEARSRLLHRAVAILDGPGAIDDATYTKLTAIAPTITEPKALRAQDWTWPEQLKWVGRILGNGMQISVDVQGKIQTLRAPKRYTR